MSTDLIDRSELTRDPIAYADKIWQKYRELCRSKEFVNLPNQERLTEFQRMYPLFTRDHPVVMRYLVQEGLYSRKAFQRYINKMISDPPQSEELMLRAYADYVAFLYRYTTRRHYGAGELGRIREDTFQMLKRETDDFKANYEKAKKKVDEERAADTLARQRELLDRFTQMRAATANVTLPYETPRE